MPEKALPEASWLVLREMQNLLSFRNELEYNIKYRVIMRVEYCSKMNVKIQVNRGEILMSDVTLAFTRDQIIEANQLKDYSQKKLRQEILDKEQIAIHFSDGLQGVILSYERFESLAKYIEELEDTLEEMELTKLVSVRNPDITDPTQWTAYKEGFLVSGKNPHED